MNSNKKDTKDIIGDRIAVLVKTINDNPDELHYDYTPSVYELITYEKVGIEAVLSLLNSKDKMERYRAQRVVEGVIQRDFGWKAGQGYPKNSDGEKLMLALWKVNGNYNAEAAEKERLEAIDKWKVWLTENNKDGEEE